MKMSEKWNKHQLTRFKISIYLGLPLFVILGIFIISLSFIRIEELWGLTLFGVGITIFSGIGFIFAVRYLNKIEKDIAQEEEDFEKYKKFYEENKK